jgi:hypothetical protein
MASGDYRQVGASGDWASTTALVGHAGNLYAVSGGNVFQLSPWDGQYQKLGGGGWNPRFLFSSLGRLVSLEASGTVFTLSPQDGSYEKASGDGAWASTAAATAVRDTVLTCGTNGEMWRYRPRFGDYQKLPVQGTWASRLMAATTDGLFTNECTLVTIEQSGSMYAIDLASGAYRQLPGSWPNARAMVGMGGAVYVADASGGLYAIDVATGNSRQIGNSNGWKTRLFAAVNNQLFSLEESGTIFAVEP